MSKAKPFQNIRRTIGTVVFLLAGPIVWALHLLLTYGSQSALCAFSHQTGAEGFIVDPVNTIIVVTLGAVFASLPFFARPAGAYKLLAGDHAPENQWTFFRSVSQLLTGLSILAVIYAGTAVLILPTCAQLR